MTTWIEIAAFVVGLGLGARLSISPRFGMGSRSLLFLIMPTAFSAGIQALGPQILELSSQDCFRLSFALIILAAAGGHISIGKLSQDSRWTYIFPASTLSLLLAALLYLIDPPYLQGVEVPQGYLALGLVGYISSVFLLILSVIVLANLEQILRKSNETLRWELKFLFLGIGALYAAIIYMSSQVLLFPPRKGLLLTSAIGLLHLIFLISCTLIFASWKRSSGKIQIAVSHGAIYSSITLLCVGAYLIASSLIARWASQWGDIGLPTEALIFFLSAIILATLILGTGLRHRAKAWIRRNIFAGRYDYRQFWLEATERIRSNDPPAAIASALADIVHKALGAIDVSVWIRRWDPTRLHQLGYLGNTPHQVGHEISGVVEQLLDTSDPVALADLASSENIVPVREFTESTHASLLVPLVSSNRIVGVISVGADRSGRPYDNEAREFLRALGGHAAGEFHKSELLATLVEAKEDEAFRAFSTFVLHDLKNFASTLSYIAQNAPKHQHNPDFQQDAFQSVYDTAEKMKRLCNSLRTFSGALAADRKMADLNQIVRETADTLNAGMPGNLKLELENLPLVLVDAEEVKRVIQNLVLNAREAGPENGHIIIRTAEIDGKVELTVQDSGKGMSPEYLENELFIPFRTTKSGGLGIGLFQSKKIMEAHQGSITVESEEGKGTKASLMFPKPQIARISGCE
jgi:putative PEP-CTERM system histidine kinase